MMRLHCWLCVLLAAPAAAAPGAERFFLDLQAARLELSAAVAGSGLARRAAQGLSPEEVRAKVAALVDPSVPSAFVERAFADPRVKPIPGLEDRFKPAPPGGQRDYDAYRRYFMTEARIAAGARFAREHRDLLERVERTYGVDAHLLAAFVGIETFYGAATGKFGVFNAFYTIAMKVPSRSDWAARELAQYLKLCRRDRVEPQSVSGSYAGAFGYFQFLPSSFNAYAVDFDGDGRRRWDEWPDVLASVANYEARAGYERGGPFTPGSRNWRAIYAYNHDDFYVRVVIELREALIARAGSA